jgi:hypothetical protein
LLRCGGCLTARRVTAATRPLSGLRVLAGHRGNEPVKPCFAGQLRVERRRDDVPLADSDRAAVVQTRHHVRSVANPFDDGRSDEDTVDRRVTEHRHVEVRFEAVELTSERVATHGNVE